MAALAKALAICAGTVGGAAACVATGVAPAPLDLAPQQAREATIERISERAIEESAPPVADYEPLAPAPEPEPSQPPVHEQGVGAEAAEPAPTAAAAGAVEYAPPPAEAAPRAPSSGASSASSGSAAGEFGP